MRKEFRAKCILLLNQSRRTTPAVRGNNICRWTGKRGTSSCTQSELHRVCQWTAVDGKQMNERWGWQRDEMDWDRIIDEWEMKEHKKVQTQRRQSLWLEWWKMLKVREINQSTGLLIQRKNNWELQWCQTKSRKLCHNCYKSKTRREKQPFPFISNNSLSLVYHTVYWTWQFPL